MVNKIIYYKYYSTRYTEQKPEGNLQCKFWLGVVCPQFRGKGRS